MGSVVSNTSNFALRMPPEMKEAIVALSKISLPVPTKLPGLEGKKPNSANEAILYLMQLGFEQILAGLEYRIKKIKINYDILQEIVTFFFDNPEISHLKEEDLPENSRARKYVAEFLGKNNIPLFAQGFGRGWAYQELTTTHAILSMQVAAAEAIKQALPPALNLRSSEEVHLPDTLSKPLKKGEQ